VCKYLILIYNRNKLLVFCIVLQNLTTSVLKILYFWQYATVFSILSSNGLFLRHFGVKIRNFSIRHFIKKPYKPITKMKRALIIILLLNVMNVFGQGTTTEKGLNLSFSGFVKNDFIFDTRRNVEAVDGLYTLWPLKPQFDANGVDINAQPSARMFSIATRFATRLSGLEIGEVKVGAYVELDFTGGDAANSIRLRHTYTTVYTGLESSVACLAEPGILLLLRKYFRELWPDSIPVYHFSVFNRSPQLRFTHHVSNNLLILHLLQLSIRSHYR
jgi:hypothetical protein